MSLPSPPTQSSGLRGEVRASSKWALGLRTHQNPPSPVGAHMHPQDSPPAPLELGSTWPEAGPLPELKQGVGDGGWGSG